ncbi:adenosylcobinamide-GDP ribazoletransferase [Thermodesulfobacteriota bacterium]
MLARLYLAITFLTRIPAGSIGKIQPAELARTALFFPVVGWLIGGLFCAIAWLGSMTGLTAGIVAILLVAFGAWLTRGLHLDGWADLLDGLGGGYVPEKRLLIMKDSSLGVFGGVGLVLLLLLKVSCLSSILAQPAEMKYLLLAGAPVTARWAMVLLAFRSKYPRLAGTGHPFVGKIAGSDLLLGVIMVLPVLAAGLPGLTVVLASLVPAVWLRIQCRQALGGITGDVLGAGCELGEAAGWLATVFWLSGNLIL